MTDRELLQQALAVIEDFLDAIADDCGEPNCNECSPYKIAREVDELIRARLAQPEQKYRRGNTVLCLETEELCLVWASGVTKQWVRFPDGSLLEYTNEQMAELFELIPSHQEQEPEEKYRYGLPLLEAMTEGYAAQQQAAQPEQEPIGYLCENAVGHKYFRWKKPPSTYNPTPLYTAPQPAQRTWVGLTSQEKNEMTWGKDIYEILELAEAKLKEKNT